jgi:hypothetical protein
VNYLFLDKFYDTNWVLAIKKKHNNTPFFLENEKSKFNIVKNPWRYWCADPFLFDYNGKTFIFCEAFDIFHDKGIIAYRYIKKNGKLSKLKSCLNLPFHLSYPYIFNYNGEVFMVPETGSVDEIQLYKAIQFPQKWEKCQVLLKDISACDTNFLSYNENTYMFTLIFDKKQDKYVYDKLFVYFLDGENFVSLPSNPVVTNTKLARNAGNFILHNDVLYRVSQNCSQMYGENLNFLKITNLSPTSYNEELIKTICLNDITTNDDGIYDGIHTYNCNEQYEIIDLQIKKCIRIERVVYLILNKVKSLLCRMVRINK